MFKIPDNGIPDRFWETPSFKDSDLGTKYDLGSHMSIEAGKNT
jgi:hypothetical protein